MLRWLAVSIGALALVSLVGHQSWTWWRLFHRSGFLGASEARTALLWHAAACVLLGGLAAVGSRRLRDLSVATAVAAPVGLVIATSLAGRALDIVVTAMVLVAAWKVGDVALARLDRPGGRSMRLVPAVPVVVGLVVIGVAVQVIGRVGAISVWTCGVPFIAVGLLGLRDVTRRSARAVPAVVSEVRSSALHAASAVVLSIQLAWALLYAAAPEIQFDAVYGKAWLPALWSEVGRIRTLVEHPVMANVGFSQLDAVPGHVLGADGIGRYLQVAAGALIVVSLWHLGRRRTSWTGPVLAVGIGVMPHVLWQSSTAYDDLLLALACLALGIVVVQVPAVGSGYQKSALLTGVLAGGVVAFKLHLVVFAIVAALGWCWCGGRQHFFRRSALVASGAAAVALPGAVFRYVDTGNPLFPQFNALFQSDFFPAVNTTWNMPYASGGPLELLKLPWTLAEEPGRLTEAVPTGAFGLSLLVLAAALALLRPNRSGRGAMWAALLVALAAWWLQLRYARYLLPYVVVAAGLLAMAFAQRRGRPSEGPPRARLVAVTVIALAATSFASSVASFWNVPGRVPVAAAFGRESREAYVRRAMPTYAAIDAFNRLAEQNAMMTGDAHARTLLRPDLDFTPQWELDGRVRLSGRNPTTTAELYDAWRALGVRWLVIAEGRRTTDLEPSRSLVGGMLRDYGRVRFAGRGYELYELGLSPRATPRATGKQAGDESDQTARQ